MSRHVQEKKEAKRAELIKAALSLFTSKSIQDVSVADLTTHAGVAKGTFYLFFKDKYELADVVIAQESSRILSKAQKELEQMQFHDFQDAIVFMIQQILQQFENSPVLLRLVRRNLSFGVFHKHLHQAKVDDSRDLSDAFAQLARSCGYHYEDPQMVFFMILELTGSMCYSALVEGVPAPIDQVKPALFTAVRAILSSAKQQEQN